jgi:radical SAM superfamily enzyme YgiQ (UPF0313 family)
MKILLVQPAHYTFPEGKLLKAKHKKGLCPSYILPYLASLFPQGAEIEIIDETLKDIDFQKQYDLVGISISTHFAKRAYEIANTFRDKNIKVVLGGYHVNLCPEEAEKYADAIIVGEAEVVWDDFLGDLYSRRIKKRYYATKRFDMKGMSFPRYGLLGLELYRAFYGTLMPVETSRGCSNRCDFCCEPQAYPGGVIYRPVQEVVHDIKKILVDYKHLKPGFLFTAPNLTADPKHAEELFQALIPLKIRWAGFVSFHFCMDRKLVELASRSGCYSVILGLESINQPSLNSVNKGFNKLSEFPNIVKRLTRNNIMLTTGILLGLPEDSPETFTTTIEFLIKNRVAGAFINTPYPYPNTPFYNRLKEEGRLYDDKFWLKVHNPLELF